MSAAVMASMTTKVPTKGNRNNAEEAGVPATLSTVVPRRSARTNKGVPPLQYIFMTHPFNLLFLLFNLFCQSFLFRYLPGI